MYEPVSREFGVPVMKTSFQLAWSEMPSQLNMIKVTRHLCFKNSKKLQLMDVQACISAITVREGIYDLLAELKARMF